MNNYSYEKRGAVMENNERKIENCNGNIIHEDIVVRVKDLSLIHIYLVSSVMADYEVRKEWLRDYGIKMDL